tara:strand:+ start:710 stop:994 length:285 start_codon:yes stop_codon:yes gene_type:complete
MKRDSKIFNIILVYVSRTWERIRLTQPFEEMSMDNISSVDFIVEVADDIYDNDIIQGFVGDTTQQDYFLNTVGVLSDTYIESEAEKIIRKEFQL